MRNPPRTVVESTDCELIAVDEQILAILAEEGARTTKHINAEIEDVGKSWVCKRLQRLCEDGPVQQVNLGLYELEDDIDGGER